MCQNSIKEFSKSIYNLFVSVNKFIRFMKKKIILLCLMFVTTFTFGQWTAQTSGSTSWLNSVFFVNDTSGWVVGANGTVLHTGDGGLSWNTQTSPVSSFLRTVFFY